MLPNNIGTIVIDIFKIVKQNISEFYKFIEIVSSRNLQPHSQTQNPHGTMVMAPGCGFRMLGFEF